MRHGRWTIRFACMFLLAQATACGGGSSPTHVAVGLQGTFAGSSTAATANTVQLDGTPSGDLVTVSVMINGPTTNTDLYSFAFDLVLGDPTVAELESGSAVFGSALTLSGSQAPQVLAAQIGDRVTVGVSKVGAGAGNGIGADTETVVTLQFRMLTAGSTTLTIEGSPPHDPAALDSTGAEVASVIFDAGPATLSAF